MRRLSSALVTFALIAQPLSAFAFYETPGAVLQAVQFDASAKTITGEVHGNNGTMYVSAWLKGQMEGAEYADAKVSAQVTVDLEDAASHVKGRFKGAVMILDGQLYAKVDSVEGTFEDDALMGTMRFAVKKWISVPVDADTVAAIQNAITQTGDPAEADSKFSFHRTPYQYGSSYTLTMNQSEEDLTSLEIKVDTDYKDTVQVSKVTFEGMANGFTLNGQVKAEKMKYDLTLTAPVDIISIDMLMNHLGAIGSSLDTEELIPHFPMNDSQQDVKQDAPPARTVRPRVQVQQSASSLDPIDRVHSRIKKPSRRLLKMGDNTDLQ